MYLPEIVQRSAVIISDPCGPLGTGFFLSTRSYPTDAFWGYAPRAGKDESLTTYLVTAAHNLKHLGREEAEVSFVRRDGTPGTFSVRSQDWRFHPTERSMVDVAAAEVPAGVDHNHTVIDYTDLAVDEVLRHEAIGLGDDLYIAGLFSALQDSALERTPIVRSGNIAMIPSSQPIEVADKEDGVVKVFAHLIEVRSIGGLSGSPVFVDTRGARKRPDSDQVYEMRNPTTFFYGLIRGHWSLPGTAQSDSRKSKLRRKQERERQSRAEHDEKDRVNTGIVLVVPAQKVYEVVNQEWFVNRRREQKKREMRERAPTLDSARPNRARRDENQQAKSAIDQIAKRTEGRR